MISKNFKIWIYISKYIQRIDSNRILYTLRVVDLNVKL